MQDDHFEARVRHIVRTYRVTLARARLLAGLAFTVEAPR